MAIAANVAKKAVRDLRDFLAVWACGQNPPAFIHLRCVGIDDEAAISARQFERKRGLAAGRWSGNEQGSACHVPSIGVNTKVTINNIIGIIRVIALPRSVRLPVDASTRRIEPRIGGVQA